MNVILSILLSPSVILAMPSSESPRRKEVKFEASHLEYAERAPSIAYRDSELEPQLHWRTYVALASMCILQFVLLSALLGPPSAVSVSLYSVMHNPAVYQTDRTIVTAYHHRHRSERRYPQKVGGKRNDTVPGRPRSHPRQRLRHFPVPKDNPRCLYHAGNDRLCYCSRI